MGKHCWGNYFLAAYKGVFEHLAAKGQARPTPVGLQVVVHGRVPTGGRALTVGAGTAIKYAHDGHFVWGAGVRAK